MRLELVGGFFLFENWEDGAPGASGGCDGMGWDGMAWREN